MKTLIELIGMLLGFKSKQAVDEGLVDYSGQGRDEYGK